VRWISATGGFIHGRFVTRRRISNGGAPEFTFVPAPNYNEILLDVRRAGKPVILEGQSGTGKTTCVKRIITELNDQAPTEYLTARNPVHISRIESIVRDQGPGRFVIDDFHRLAQTLQEQIADVAKISAEVGDATLLPKLIIIGINQIGSGLGPKVRRNLLQKRGSSQTDKLLSSPSGRGR
jgi:hypothetical protein